MDRGQDYAGAEATETVRRRVGFLDRRQRQHVVERGQEQGELRHDLSPRLAAWIIYGALEEILTGWVLGRLPGSEDDIRDAEQAVVGILCDGLVSR